MSRFRKIFPDGEPLIALAHTPALPGTPLYDASAGLSGAVSDVRRDVDILLDAGFDAVLFCNENDRPYELQAGTGKTRSPSSPGGVGHRAGGSSPARRSPSTAARSWTNARFRPCAAPAR